MGIAIGGGQMISAHSPKIGTTITPIQGPAGEILSVRRI
jgi:hypothetical protein